MRLYEAQGSLIKEDLNKIRGKKTLFFCDLFATILHLVELRFFIVYKQVSLTPVTVAAHLVVILMNIYKLLK